MTFSSKLLAFSVLILTLKQLDVGGVPLGEQDNQGFRIFTALEKRDSEFKTDKIRPRLGKRVAAYVGLQVPGNLVFSSSPAGSRHPELYFPGPAVNIF